MKVRNGKRFFVACAVITCIVLVAGVAIGFSVANSHINTLKDEISVLKSDKTSLETEISTLSDENRKYQSEIARLEKINKNSVEQISLYKKHLSEKPLGYVIYKANKLGYDETKINELIRIVIAESKGDPKAINQNTNGTWDAGLFQVNQCHGKTLASMLNYKNNVDYALEGLYQYQGTKPWISSRGTWSRRNIKQ